MVTELTDDEREALQVALYLNGSRGIETHVAGLVAARVAAALNEAAAQIDARFAAALRLLAPDDITPAGRRQLEAVLNEYAPTTTTKDS